MTDQREVRSRPWGDECDIGRVYDLVASQPDRALHLADLPWRLCAPSVRDPDRTRLWETVEGTMLAWTVLQAPWSCVDFGLAAAAPAGLGSSVVAWAIVRAQRLTAALPRPSGLFASSRSTDAVRVALLERAGFVHVPHVTVHMVCRLTNPIAPAPLPSGFAIRPLGGEAEAEPYVRAHRAAFGSESMTVDWRIATIRDPHHIPELDLVATAPDRSIAGFCVCWMTPSPPAWGGRRTAQVEPMGVLPDHRRLGLGRALLVEAFHRARAMGADQIEVDCASSDAAARGAYESAGFRAIYDAWWFCLRPGDHTSAG